MSPAATPRVKRFADYAPTLLFMLVGFLYVHDDNRRTAEHLQVTQSTAAAFEAVADRFDALEAQVAEHETDIGILKYVASATPAPAGE